MGKGAGNWAFPNYNSNQLDGEPKAGQRLEGHQELVINCFNWEVLEAKTAPGLALLGVGLDDLSGLFQPKRSWDSDPGTAWSAAATATPPSSGQCLIRPFPR